MRFSSRLELNKFLIFAVYKYGRYMKKLLIAAFMLISFAGYSQETLKPKVNIELETAMNANFTEDEFDQMAFQLKRLRLEFKGNLGDNLSYHFRSAYHKKADPFTLDGISKSIELAKIAWTPNDSWEFAAGKLFVEHAGYENYVNVLLVREFSDFVNCIEVYQTGAMATYHFSPEHMLTFQVVNNRAESDRELYAYGLPDGMESAKVPLMGTLNWNGWFADRSVRLMYSATASQVAQGKYMYYLMGGNIYEKGPILAYLDVLYARADVDKHQRVTNLGRGLLPTAQNTEYLTLIADFEYQFTPKWRAYVKGAYETSSVYKDNGGYKKGHYLTSWNAQASVEWFPFTAARGLKVYLHYLYKGNELHDRALDLNASLPDMQRISLGLTYAIPVL